VQADQSAFDTEQLAAAVMMPVEFAGAEPKCIAGLIAAPDSDCGWSVEALGERGHDTMPFQNRSSLAGSHYFASECR
jgi:hypothetical protein